MPHRVTRSMSPTVATIHDPFAMRRAGRELLSLALIDARNRTLRWLSAFNGAPVDALRGEFDPPLWLVGHVAWFQECAIARNLRRAQGESAAGSTTLASIEPRADAWFDPTVGTREQRWRDTDVGRCAPARLPGGHARRHARIARARCRGRRRAAVVSPGAGPRRLGGRDAGGDGPGRRPRWADASQAAAGAGDADTARRGRGQRQGRNDSGSVADLAFARASRTVVVRRTAREPGHAARRFRARQRALGPRRAGARVRDRCAAGAVVAVRRVRRRWRLRRAALVGPDRMGLAGASAAPRAALRGAARPGRARAARRSAAASGVGAGGGARQLARGRRVVPLGLAAPAHRARMGDRCDDRRLAWLRVGRRARMDGRARDALERRAAVSRAGLGRTTRTPRHCDRCASRVAAR